MPHAAPGGLTNPPEMLGICQSQASISEYFGKTFRSTEYKLPANVKKKKNKTLKWILFFIFFLPLS
jgi:hypothetical protein